MNFQGAVLIEDLSGLSLTPIIPQTNKKTFTQFIALLL